MIGQFTSGTVSLGQLFANPISIEAPGYQRSFAWTAEEAGQLFADISQALAEDTDYFLSFMLFIERNRPRSLLPAWARARSERVLEIVDGFQRLTSLTILFCTLRDLDAEQGQPTNARLATAIGPDLRRRLALRPVEAAFFEKCVQAPGATRIKPTGANLAPAEGRIIAVRDHFLAELGDMEVVDRPFFVDFLLDHCCVASVITNDIDRAHQLFTILNARGKPLARRDILKATLLGGVPAEAAAKAASLWQDLDQRLGDEFENLFSHVRSMYGRAGGHVIASVKEIVARNGGALPFLEGVLRPAAGVFHDLRRASHHGSSHSATIERMLSYLNRLRFSDWIPPALLWRLTKGEDAAELAWFLLALDRLALGIRLLGLGAHKRASWFGAVTAAIRNGEDLKAANGVLNFSRQDVRTMQYNLRDLHARDASTAKHLLLRLNDHMAGNPQSFSFPDDMSVEHVLPRKSNPNSQWRGWFADPSERESYTESLGNLVLVTKAQNDRAGNQDFARKLEVYFKTPAAPLPALNEALHGVSEWKPPQIRAREAEMLRLIENLWNFGLKIGSSEAGEPAPLRRRRASG
jgi:Protein of unknown function DUF262/Protein of unknown function (DUF1524)